MTQLRYPRFKIPKIYFIRGNANSITVNLQNSSEGTNKRWVKSRHSQPIREAPLQYMGSTWLEVSQGHSRDSTSVVVNSETWLPHYGWPFTVFHPKRGRWSAPEDLPPFPRGSTASLQSIFQHCGSGFLLPSNRIQVGWAKWKIEFAWGMLERLQNP